MLLSDVSEDDGHHVLQVPAKVLGIASLARRLDHKIQVLSHETRESVMHITSYFVLWGFISH